MFAQFAQETSVQIIQLDVALARNISVVIIGHNTRKMKHTGFQLDN